MKNTTYIVEVYASRSSWDYPTWHVEATHKTLANARKKRTTLMNTTGWTPKEIRVVEVTRRVIRFGIVERTRKIDK